MAIGVVKWFDPKKGFGFVLNEKGEDVFVHYTSIEGDGFRCLRSGQKVTYQEVGSKKGLQGIEVRSTSDDESVVVDDEPQAKSVHY